VYLQTRRLEATLTHAKYDSLILPISLQLLVNIFSSWNHRPYSASSRRVAPAVSPNASSSRTQTPQYFVVHSATGKATLQQRPTSANAASRQKSSQQTNASFRGFAGRATPTTRTGTSSKQSAPDVAKHRSSLAATTVESTLDSIPTPHSSLPSEEDDREKRRQVERKSRSAERVSSENTAGYGNAYPLRSHSGNYGQRPQSAKMSSSRNQYTSQRERQHLQASAESTSGSSGQHQPKAHAPSSSSGGVDAAASGQPRNVHAQYTKAVGIPQRPQSASAASSKHAAVPPPYSRPTVSQSNQRPAWHGKLKLYVAYFMYTPIAELNLLFQHLFSLSRNSRDEQYFASSFRGSSIAAAAFFGAHKYSARVSSACSSVCPNRASSSCNNCNPRCRSCSCCRAGEKCAD